MKQLIHDNINPLIGMWYVFNNIYKNKFSCNNSTEELLVLWKYCSRGTLRNYLLNLEMRMDENFKISFLRDIINVTYYCF